MLYRILTELKNKADKTIWENEKNAIKAYEVVSDRIKALEKALALDPEGLRVLVMEVIEEAQAQSAGGNALTHALEEPPGIEDIHPALGGQLQAPPPQPPALDPNAAPAEPAPA